MLLYKLLFSRKIALVGYELDGVNNVMTSAYSGRLHHKYRNREFVSYIRMLAMTDMKKKFPSLQNDWGISTVNDGANHSVKRFNGRLIGQKIRRNT